MKIKIRNKFKFIYAIVIIIVLITLVITLIVTNIKNKSIDTAIKETKVEENIALANATLYNIKENISSRLNDWKLILVNKENYLPDNYEVNLKTINGNMKVDERIYNDLKNMLNDAKKENLDLLICSSYRSTSKQKKLFNDKIKEYKNKGYSDEEAYKEASYWVLIPGTSEHETGLSVDIVSIDNQVLDENQEKTKEQKWLMENSYKYGFILRYPTNKKDITGVNYEPWHYRYVGKENALQIKKLNVCLEEYIEILKESLNKTE